MTPRDALPAAPPLIVRASDARRLSALWRTSTDAGLRGRRRMLRGYLGATTTMTVIAAYQTGLTRTLPELPFRPFDAPRVDASPQAYQLLGMPDALLALLSNATTMALIGAGGRDRPRWLRRLTALKAGVDAAYSAKLTVDQVRKHRSLCSWCLLTTASTFSALPDALRQAR